MSRGRVIGRERHNRHCGHIEEYWERDGKFQSYSDCSPACEGWGGVK